MRVVSAEDVDACLDFPTLVDALNVAFRDGVEAPVRHHHTIATHGADQTLLLMPAWNGTFTGVKLVLVSPDNSGLGLPAVMGSYILMDGKTGAQLALVDGARLTVWRTAAASALAARYLARQDAEELLVIGAGALAPFLVRAHMAVRDYKAVKIWNRNQDKAADLASRLRGEGLPVDAAAALEDAVRAADTVSCATLSTVPIVRGEWLRPGAHLDLVGAFTPAMRESDDDCVRRARIFVDTRGGALKEGGDLVQPITAGIISSKDVVAELSELARGEAAGRMTQDEITLFKSTGASLEDLAGAILVAKRIGIGPVQPNM